MSVLGKVSLGGLLLLVTPAAAQQSHTNLVYGPAERNVMDIYLPDGVENPPLVMYIHGGAWFRGDKAQVEDYDRRAKMNAAGIAVATINYQWSQQAKWPAQKQDIEAAIRFLQENAGEFGYDMNRFVVWGQSSGAHLALWSAAMAAQDPSLGIDAVVSWYAPSNLYELWDDRLADDVPGGNEREPDPTPESQLLGMDARQNRDAADAASADIALGALPADAVIPPILLVHGTADTRVSPLQSDRVFEVLQARGADVQLIRVEGGNHGGEGFDEIVAPSMAHIEKHLSD